MLSINKLSSQIIQNSFRVNNVSSAMSKINLSSKSDTFERSTGISFKGDETPLLAVKSREDLKNVPKNYTGKVLVRFDSKKMRLGKVDLYVCEFKDGKIVKEIYKDFDNGKIVCENEFDPDTNQKTKETWYRSKNEPSEERKYDRENGKIEILRKWNLDGTTQVVEYDPKYIRSSGQDVGNVRIKQEKVDCDGNREVEEFDRETGYRVVYERYYPDKTKGFRQEYNRVTGYKEKDTIYNKEDGSYIVITYNEYGNEESSVTKYDKDGNVIPR